MYRIICISRFNVRKGLKKNFFFLPVFWVGCWDVFVIENSVIMPGMKHNPVVIASWIPLFCDPGSQAAHVFLMGTRWRPCCLPHIARQPLLLLFFSFNSALHNCALASSQGWNENLQYPDISLYLTCDTCITQHELAEKSAWERMRENTSFVWTSWKGKTITLPVHSQRVIHSRSKAFCCMVCEEPLQTSTFYWLIILIHAEIFSILKGMVSSTRHEGSLKALTSMRSSAMVVTLTTSQSSRTAVEDFGPKSLHSRSPSLKHHVKERVNMFRDVRLSSTSPPEACSIYVLAEHLTETLDLISLYTLSHILLLC